MAETRPVSPAGLEDRLRAHVERLAGAIGERNVWRPEALEAAREYIGSEWERQGYRVRPQWLEARGVRCANLEAERRGVAIPGAILLLGAHYDTVAGSPGANDNATGLAALLEISRGFADLAPASTARFVAFVNEEPPFFGTHGQGSALYASEARRRGEDIRLMVSLETIGCYREEPGSQRFPPPFGLFYPNRGNFIAFVSDFRSGRALRRAAMAFRAVSEFPLVSAATFRSIPGVGWSDHQSFWRQGYPAIMVTDTAPFRDPNYHTGGDAPDQVCYEPLARLVEGLSRAFQRLCLDPAGPA